MIFETRTSDRTDIPLGEIKERLRDQADDLFRSLWGEPNRDTLNKQEWRWGSHGSLAAIVRDGAGKQRGSFYTHEGSQGGGPLDAIMFARGCGFREAVAWSTTFLGIAPTEALPPIPDHVLEERAKKRAEQDAEAEAYRQQRTETAARTWNESVDPIGTLGARYLAKRAIHLPDIAPSAVRWHPANGSLVFASTRDDGAMQAVQRIYLGQDARKLEKPELDRRRLPAAKITTGPADGAAVRLPGPTTGPILLAEGPETGLSVWQATGHETWIALGQLAKLKPPAGRLVILCRDDDRKPKPEHKGPTPEDRHRKFVAELRGRGHQVVTVLPWSERRHDGSDFNDVLQVDGNAGVAARINGAIPPDLPPEFTAPTHTLNKARADLVPKVASSLRAAIRANIATEAAEARRKAAQADLKAWDETATLDEPTDFQREQRAALAEAVAAPLPDPPHHGFKVGLGIGKTHAVAEGIGTYLAEAHAAGIVRGVLWTAPTLALADQTAAMMAGNGTSVGVYRGRRAPNPNAEALPKDANDDSGRMCLDLPAVRLAHDAGANVAETVCGKERGEDHERCVHYTACPFQLNNRTLRDKDVVVAAHNALLQELPAKVEAGRGLTVVDETFWQAGLSTTELSIVHLVADLADAPVRGAGGEPDDFATDVLRSTMAAVQNALATHADATPLSSEVFREHGLDPAQCRGSAREQWRRKIPLDMRPGMPIEERRAASREAATNKRIPAMAKLLHVVADILDGNRDALGRIELATVDLKAGPDRRVVLHHLKGLVQARLERPILHLDATMPVAAVRQYLPRLDVVAEIDAAAPHMRLVQVLSTRENRGGWGRTSTIPDEAPHEEERDRRQGRIDGLRDLVGLLHQQFGAGMVVTYKALEEQFAGLPGVATAHFNAVAGLNGHQDVAWAIVAGRPMPNPRATAEIVKQLFGRWIDAADPVEMPAGLLMADGSRRTIETRRFANADMEAVRKAIADDNVVQSIGRVRAVRRTSANPVAVLLLSDVVTPFPLAAVTDWPTLALDRVERMATRGLVFDSPTDAAKAFPDLFPTARAARDAFRPDRRSSAQTPMFISILGVCALDQTAVIARYRPLPTPTEPKPKTRTLTVTDVARLPGLRGWLEALVGPLALFEITQPVSEPCSSGPDPSPVPEPSQVSVEAVGLDPGRVFPRVDAFAVPVPDLILSVRTRGTTPWRVVISADAAARRPSVRAVLHGPADASDASGGLLHPSVVLPVAEVPSRPGAGDQLTAQTRDGNVVPIRPRGPPSSSPPSAPTDPPSPLPSMRVAWDPKQ